MAVFTLRTMLSSSTERSALIARSKAFSLKVDGVTPFRATSNLIVTMETSSLYDAKNTPLLALLLKVAVIESAESALTTMLRVRFTSLVVDGAYAHEIALVLTPSPSLTTFVSMASLNWSLETPGSGKLKVRTFDVTAAAYDCASSPVSTIELAAVSTSFACATGTFTTTVNVMPTAWRRRATHHGGGGAANVTVMLSMSTPNLELTSDSSTFFSYVNSEAPSKVTENVTIDLGTIMSSYIT